MVFSIDVHSPMELIRLCWIIFGLYWLVSALNRKTTKKRESYFQRFRYTILLVVGLWFLFRSEGHYGWLGTRFLPADPFSRWLGVALTAAGTALAIWARWHLGTNWSGVVTLKEGHELIRTGPYRAIRHPIYTGLLLALLGTAVTIGEVRGLLAVVIAWISFYMKARREESFLTEEFGRAFEEHRRHTGMFLPRLSISAN